jgi:hypothetical protein
VEFFSTIELTWLIEGRVAAEVGVNKLWEV